MRPVDAVITKFVDETPSIRTIFFDTFFEQVPGQFVMVWVCGVDEIPMALSYENAITVHKAGEATSALFELDECDSIGIRGPFGNGFGISGKNILLISGGVGAAPLAPLAERAASSGISVTTMLGAIKKDELLFGKRFETAGKVLIATDDGSEGRKGYVTDLLDDNDVDADRFDSIYCCGPEPMMKKVLDSSIIPEKVQFSLHRYFKCGIGVCGACCIDGLRVCKDGPVFRGDVLKDTEFGKFKRDGCGCKVKV
ncbi:MAG: dihydroorotate dehydrogenase electron transfer subunit [Candidatus Methanoperedens sp.]|nr:dihydroorotate dehydrogenase electron transfer subunit [Candidatus Methanoperedens sp.]